MRKFTLVLLSSFLFPYVSMAGNMTGKIFKSNKDKHLAFDFIMNFPKDNPKIVYEVKGTVASTKGISDIHPILDYSSVSVKKSIYSEQGVLKTQKGFKNEGYLDTYFFNRETRDSNKKDGILTIADIPISGNFEHGRLDDDIDLNDLKVNNYQSQGRLNYCWGLTFIQAYFPKDNCSFGNCVIQPATQNEDVR